MELDISGNALDAAAIGVIPGLVHLRRLVMVGCDLNQVDLRPLINLKQLRELDVRGNDLSKGDLSKLLPGLWLRSNSR